MIIRFNHRKREILLLPLNMNKIKIEKSVAVDRLKMAYI